MTEQASVPKEKILYCSFCGKSQKEVAQIIAGPVVFICNECVDLCNDIIREQGGVPGRRFGILYDDILKWSSNLEKDWTRKAVDAWPRGSARKWQVARNAAVTREYLIAFAEGVVEELLSSGAGSSSPRLQLELEELARAVAGHILWIAKDFGLEVRPEELDLPFEFRT